VFYTNSRYAKVGGLPPHELNQLELQFLLLNDFRLVIPYDEMQRYGNRLLGYWENKEAEEKNGVSNSHTAEVPTVEQTTRAEEPAAASDSTTTFSKTEEDGPTSTTSGETTPSHSNPQPHSDPTPTDRERQLHQAASRTASIDPTAPINAQAPMTTA